MWNWLKNLFSGKVRLTSDGNVYKAIQDERKANGEGGLFSGIFGGNFGNLVNSLIARLTANELTGAEREANEFSAAEAEKSRNFTEFMARNKYQMETQSMEESGINPAMVYGGGNLVSTVANGAAPSSVSPSPAAVFDILPNLVRLPAEVDQMKAEAQRARDEGQAALMNAASNARNASSQERQASVAEVRAQIERDLADSNISLNDEQKNKIAEEALKIADERATIQSYLAVAEKNADSQQKQAIAALRQADAAVQNAATNNYLSTYQSSLYYAEEMLKYAETEGKSIVNRYLPERQRQELDNLQKQGVKLDAEGRLIDKQGNLCTAQMIKTYINCGTDIANSVSRFVGISALAGSKTPPSEPTTLWYPRSGQYFGESYGPLRQ